MRQDLGAFSGSRERSQSSLSPPVGFDPGEFSASLDAALDATGYTQADAIWHRATDALLARDYAAFDALMHEFRATTKHWKSTRDGRGIVTASGNSR